MKDLLAEMRAVARDEAPAPSDTAQPRAESAESAGRARVARRVEDLDEDTVNVIGRSFVSATYADLDRLIQDWTP
jgi:hypothetical protein